MKTSRNYVYVILSLALAISLAALCGCGAKRVTTNGEGTSATNHQEGKPQVILFTQPG